MMREMYIGGQRFTVRRSTEQQLYVKSDGYTGRCRAFVSLKRGEILVPAHASSHLGSRRLSEVSAVIVRHRAGASGRGPSGD
jgi:hypothetical protein